MASDIWVTVQECTGLSGLPKAAQNIRRYLESFVMGRAELRRKREKSKAFEYHISVLPPDVRAELLAQRGLVETSAGAVQLPQPNAAATLEDHERRQLAEHWERASNEQRLCAERRVKAAALVAELIASGLTNRLALTTAAHKLDISEGSLRNIFYKVNGRARDLWGPLLLDRRLR